MAEAYQQIVAHHAYLLEMLWKESETSIPTHQGMQIRLRATSIVALYGEASRTDLVNGR